MPSFVPRKRSTQVILGLLLGAIFIGAVAAKKFAPPYYRAWREKKANADAREFLNKGDYAAARLSVNKTVNFNPNNIEAWKLGVEIAEKQQSPDLGYYIQRLSVAEPTLENKLRFLRTVIKLNAGYREADEMLSKIGPEASNSAEFYELAAEISRRTGKLTKAKYFLVDLVRLRPEDNKAKFELAQIRLHEGVPENKPSIRAEIRNLATDPALRTNALTLLLSDSIQSGNAAEALDLAGQLESTPNLPPYVRVNVIGEAYRKFAPSRFPVYLTELEKTSGDAPDKAIILTNYLMAVQKSDEARRWLETLSPELRKNEGIEVTYGYALLMAKDWPNLEKHLRASKWKENEYARHAMLAYCYRNAGRQREFNEEWKLAVHEIGNDARRLQTLIAQTTAWNWTEQRFELLWKRFSLDPTNRDVRQQLITWERSRGNTSQLNRIFARLMELDPKDMEAKNNYAYTSILLGLNLDRAYQSAREAYESDRKNPSFATTYAVALYRQGKMADSLQTIQSLSLAALSQPERALLHAIILIGNGQHEEGSNIVSALRQDSYLPEERRFLGEALAAVDRSRRQKGDVVRLQALAKGSAVEGGPDRKSWLSVLPGTDTKPTVQMELADSLYSHDDFRGLENSLNRESWGDKHDYLRQALLVYALRKQGKDTEALSSWKITLASAGTSSQKLTSLAALCDHWAWTAERIDVLNRVFQRDATDANAFAELVEHYTRGNQTTDLARIYQLRVEAGVKDADVKSRTAYYSLLTNLNLSRAHVLAREAYETAPENPFHAKVYAFSLFKQTRTMDASRILEKLPDQKESGAAQLSLLKAALASQRHETQQAKDYLKAFDSGSALPEENALSELIAKNVAKSDT